MSESRKNQFGEEISTTTTGTGISTILTGATGAAAVAHTHKCPTCGDEDRKVIIIENQVWIGRKSIALRWSCGHFRRIV